MERVKFFKIAGVLRYVLTALSIFPLVSAEILGMRPFGAGYFLALVFCGVPYVLAAPAYLASEFIIDFSAGNIIYSLCVGAVALLARVVLIKLKRGNAGVSVAFSAIAQIGVIALVGLANINILQGAVWALLSVAVCFASTGVVRACFVNKLKYKLLETQVVTLCALVGAAVCGMARFNPYGISIAAVLAIPSILIAAYCGSLGSGLVTGICFGVGIALRDFNVVNIAAFAFAALIGSIFLNAPRALSALSCCMGFAMFVFFFDIQLSFSYYTIAYMVLGSVIYIALPRKFLDEVKAFFNASHSVAAARSMINRAKKVMGNSLTDSAQIFREMADGLDMAHEKKTSFAGQLKNGVCANCNQFERCSKQKGYEQALNSVMESSANKGRASVSTLPSFLSVNCGHLSKLIVYANDRAEKNYAERVRLECEYSARGVVAQQLSAVSDVLKTLGLQASQPVSFDRAKERVLLDELNYRGVIATEALIYGSNISIIIRSETLCRDSILKAVKNIMHAPYMILTAESDELAGFTIVNLSIAPKYDVVFSATSMPLTKGEKCGDSHSFIKIGADKFMMALCDGMGSGEQAERASEAAINLVESFYKAGFDHQLVLSSVNKFLTLSASERYSTLDICVIDLNDLNCDIIKFAAPATVIKGKDTARSIEGSALPIGIIKDAKPDFFRDKLTVGDMVILTSDGISESFANQDMLHAVNNVRTVNPALLTNQLLEHVLVLGGGNIKDDSTVLCARVFVRT